MRLHDAADLVMFVGLLNLLIVCGVLSGGIVLGIAPTIVAAAAVSRARLHGWGGSMVRRFAREWWSQFLHAHALLGVPLAALALLGLNVLLFTDANIAVRILLGGAAAATGSYLWILASMDAHYALSRRSSWGLAARFMLRSPASPLLLTATMGLAVGITWFVPGLAPFVTLGATAFICNGLCLSFFAENERLISA